MDDPVLPKGLASPRSPTSPAIDKEDRTHSSSPISAVSIADANPSQCHTVAMCGQPIAALMIDGNERLCLAQISNTLLKNFSYNEIHNRRVALGITCVQCTPVQLEILRRAGAMPVSSRRCGMISKREAERLCKSFLCDNRPPKLPDNFAFEVYHACGWGCRGSFVPSRYNSSRAKCIKCIYCNVYHSPNKFIFHFHRIPTSKYRQHDAANFNSWRRHIHLSDEDDPGDALLHAWEDVKAMFNGGSRKRSMYHATSTSAPTKPTHNATALDLTPPVPKRSRLDLDPVINNLSLGRGIAYPIMPIPNRSFPTPANESITNDKRDTFLSASANSVFGRQFATQAIRPRTFSDLFWGNGRVPYPFPTGIWPKTRDPNFPMLSGTPMDKQFGTSYCPITPESFLGNWQLPTTSNIIDSEREEIKEDIKMRYMPPMTLNQDHIDIDNGNNKYLSAFRRVGKISSPEKDLGILESGSEIERFSTSPSDTRDGLYPTLHLKAEKRLFTATHCSAPATECDAYGKQDDGGSFEYVEEMDARKRSGSPLEVSVNRENVDIEGDETTSNVTGKEGKRKNISEDTTDADIENFRESPVSTTREPDLYTKASLRGADGDNTDDSDESSSAAYDEQRTPSTDDLKQELLKEMEQRERTNRECHLMYKDSYEGFVKREVQYRHLKDQLFMELEQERKARLTTQQKLKEAQEKLQEFSCKMLLSRHGVDGSSNTSYHTPPTADKVHKE